MPSVVNELRTRIDAISGMTAPVDISGTPQNRSVPFIQVQQTSHGYLTFDEAVREGFEIRSYGKTPDQALDNVNLIESDLDGIAGVSFGSRTVDEVLVDGIASQALTSPDGQEFFGFVSVLAVRIDHQ